MYCWTLLTPEISAAMTAHGLDMCYVPTGTAWLGRLRRSRRVGWLERSQWLADGGEE